MYSGAEVVQFSLTLSDFEYFGTFFVFNG